MTPLRITTVPRSIAGPLPGTMRAFVMAYAVGTLRSRCTPIWAASGGGAAAPNSRTPAAAVVAERERRVSIARRFLASAAPGTGDGRGCAPQDDPGARMHARHVGTDAEGAREGYAEERGDAEARAASAAARRLVLRDERLRPRRR